MLYEVITDMSHKESQKDYGIGAQILNSLDIKKIKLMTSGGKHSFVGLNGFGLEILEEIQIECTDQQTAKGQLFTPDFFLET